MFLNPTIRNKLLQKKSYMVDQRDNTFVTKVVDDRIYLQEYNTDNKPIEYKKVHFKEKKKRTKKKKQYNKDIVEEDDKSEQVSEESEQVSEKSEESEQIVSEENVEEEEKVDEESEKDYSEETEEDKNTDLYGGDALEEQKNIKTVIVHSFF